MILKEGIAKSRLISFKNLDQVLALQLQHLYKLSVIKES